MMYNIYFFPNEPFLRTNGIKSNVNLNIKQNTNKMELAQIKRINSLCNCIEGNLQLNDELHQYFSNNVMDSNHTILFSCVMHNKYEALQRCLNYYRAYHYELDQHTLDELKYLSNVFCIDILAQAELSASGT